MQAELSVHVKECKRLKKERRALMGEIKHSHGLIIVLDEKAKKLHARIQEEK